VHIKCLVELLKSVKRKDETAEWEEKLKTMKPKKRSYTIICDLNEVKESEKKEKASKMDSDWKIKDL